MRLGRLGPLGAERPVLLDGDRVLDLSGVTPDIDGAFLGSGGLERARLAWEAGDLPVLPDVVGPAGRRAGRAARARSSASA